MAERENLPAKMAAQELTTSTEKRGSLVARGMAAILTHNQWALVKADDALYRDARDTYNRITDYGNKHGIGDIWAADELTELKAAFVSFKRLADRQYGKAYFPLSRFYTGCQSIPENKELAQHYLGLAFEWCFANQLLNDPEIWNDLGSLYIIVQ